MIVTATGEGKKRQYSENFQIKIFYIYEKNEKNFIASLFLFCRAYLNIFSFLVVYYQKHKCKKKKPHKFFNINLYCNYHYCLWIDSSFRKFCGFEYGS